MIYKRISSLCLSGLLLVCNLTAQEKVTKEAFEKALDYVNCKFADYSLKKAKDVNDYAEFNKKCNCEDIPGFTKIKEAIPAKLTKNLALASEIEKYKSEYKPDMNVQAASKKFSEGMFTNATKYEAIVDFYNRNQRAAEFVELKESLNGRISEILKGTSSTATPVPAPTPAVDKNTADMMGEPPQPAAIEEEETSAFWYYLVMFMIGAIASGALIIALYTYKQLRITLALSDKERIDRSQGLSGTGYKLDSLEARYTQLYNDFQVLKRYLNDVQRNETRNPSSPSVPPNPPALAEEILYFSSPSSEGSFIVSHGSVTFTEGSSIYKLTKTGTNRARFRIDDRPMAVTLALRSVTNITPVCISENDYETKFTRITTIKEGIAELEGDRWVVRDNDKARIKYEA